MAKYLNDTWGLCCQFLANESKSKDCFANEDFCGNRNKNFADVNPAIAKSQSGLFVTYAGCPIWWATKIQTHVATSNTKADYVALSSALRDVISIMKLLDEFTNRGYNLISTALQVYCTTSKDNSGELEITHLSKMCPHTKAINAIYQHLCNHVHLGKIAICHTATNRQLANISTMPLTQNTFVQWLITNAPLHTLFESECENSRLLWILSMESCTAAFPCNCKLKLYGCIGLDSHHM